MINEFNVIVNKFVINGKDYEQIYDYNVEACFANLETKKKLKEYTRNAMQFTGVVRIFIKIRL